MPATGTPFTQSSGSLAIHLAARHDARQNRARNAKGLEQLVVPVQRFQVHQLRAAGVGAIGEMQPAGEIPQHEGVDVAEQQVARFGAGARAGDVVQNPADLERAEIGGQRQAGLGAEAVAAAIARQFRHRVGGARVLPDQRVVDGRAAVAVPHDGGFALVGDPDGRQVARPPGRAAPAPRRSLRGCAARSHWHRAPPTRAADRSARVPSARRKRCARSGRTR